MTPKYQQRLERTRTDDGWFAPRSENYAVTYTGKRGGPISKGCLATYQDASRVAKFGEFSTCFYYCQDILKNLIAAIDTCVALVSKAPLLLL
jgi:hypothetical protein